MKSQSAMEYLLSYGWAVLLIGFVIVALVYLGLFNPLYYAPKAYAGACNVDRTLGPGTTSELSLVGSCNDELPEFVTSVGSSSFVQIGNINYTPYITSAGQNAITIVIWTDPAQSDDGSYMVYFSGQAGIKTHSDPYPEIFWDEPSFACNGFGQLPGIAFSGSDFVDPFVTQCVNPTNDKTAMGFFALEFNGASMTDYYGINGQIESDTAPMSLGSTVITSPGYLTLGGGSGLGFTGYLSNLQVYDSALSTNSINQLYQEGIGGAPIDLQDLVGWWPLNGNINDYSGERTDNGGWQGAPLYTSNWWTNYNPP